MEALHPDRRRRGMLGHELRELLKKELSSELDQAMFIADKIVALGGAVRIRPAVPAELAASRDLLQENIAGERKIISNYAKRIDQAAEFGDKGLVIRLEDTRASETDTSSSWNGSGASFRSRVLLGAG